MKEMIRTEHLTFSYEGEGADVIPAVNDVSLSIDAGEYVAVLGHNGSGKSTLAKLLNMILIPSFGSIWIDGKKVTDPDFTEDDMFEIRRKVGMVFQNPDNQMVATIVEEDVAFGPENLGLPREELRARVDEALAIVGMTQYAQHSTTKLSGGQKQRVAIAGMIAMMPSCIIFDESTAMLDPIGRQEVMDTMEKLNREKGITILHITHYMEEAARANRVVVMNDGSVVADGTPKEIFSKVEQMREWGLEVPQTTDLLVSLADLGYDLPRDGITVEECIDALLPILKEQNK